MLARVRKDAQAKQARRAKLKLLPCPFCGGKAEWSGPTRTCDFGEAIQCTQCGINTGPLEHNDKKSIKIWNRRERSVLARNWDKLPKTPELIAIIRSYTAEVNRRAENKMLLTGKLEGSHHAAMREINQELGI